MAAAKMEASSTLRWSPGGGSVSSGRRIMSPAGKGRAWASEDQTPELTGPIWRATRLHTDVTGRQASLPQQRCRSLTVDAESHGFLKDLRRGWRVLESAFQHLRRECDRQAF